MICTDIQNIVYTHILFTIELLVPIYMGNWTRCDINCINAYRAGRRKCVCFVLTHIYVSHIFNEKQRINMLFMIALERTRRAASDKLTKRDEWPATEKSEQQKKNNYTKQPHWQIDRGKVGDNIWRKPTTFFAIDNRQAQHGCFKKNKTK